MKKPTTQSDAFLALFYPSRRQSLGYLQARLDSLLAQLEPFLVERAFTLSQTEQEKFADLVIRFSETKEQLERLLKKGKVVI